MVMLYSRPSLDYLSHWANMLFNTRISLLLCLAIIIGGCATRSLDPSTDTVDSERAESTSVTVQKKLDPTAAPSTSSQVKNTLGTSANLRLKTARFAHASASDGKRLYVFSGYGKQGYLTDVEIIDPQTAEVTVLANKVLPRGYFSAVYDQQHSIYLIGGVSHQTDDVREEQRIEVFDIPSQKVTVIGTIPEPLRDNKAVYLDGYIYLVGGASYNASTGYKLISSASLWRFDIKHRTWQQLANMPSAKSTALVAGKQGLFAIGGEQNLESLTNVERYDVASNTWHRMTSLPHPVSAHSAVMLNDTLWVFANEVAAQNCYYMTLNSNTWKIAKFDYQSALYTSANVLGDTLYVIGGNAGKGKSFMAQIQAFQH
ncbi:kelch repeat-containing protein [Paraglaciecola polaris LMG 21857]|uniref:Kelch repeat-containing protein n=2 Tax=Paraglaciecola polaris TaxID=222814 RepID=K6ZYU3_9ALTE|nr:kelch repeat-containing protein [Paraglaciecola polaris LMG 21857]|tara:strand:+ start:7541 stop:8656 length:1116 start_codon:yes stop_codon:yes gene_type:complete